MNVLCIAVRLLLIDGRWFAVKHIITCIVHVVCTIANRAAITPHWEAFGSARVTTTQSEVFNYPA